MGRTKAEARKTVVGKEVVKAGSLGQHATSAIRYVLQALGRQRMEVGGKVELCKCKYVAGSKVNDEGGCQIWKIWRPVMGRS